MSFQIVKLLDPIQMTITGTFNPMGAYAAGTDYAVGDMVDYQGSSYIMYSNAAAGTVPTNTTYWGLVASKGDTGATGATGPNNITTATLTDLTGILKGNGTDIDVAVAGTDYYNPGGTDVAIADGGTGASTAAAAFTALKQAASETATGVVELATDAETITGTDTTRAVTPANIQAKVASDTAKGIVELATTAETTTGTDATRAVTPDGLHDMTSLAGAAWFLDEDNMVSDSATKTASQQSIKAYVDAEVAGASGGTVDSVVAGANIDVDATDPANPIVSVENLVTADITDITASATELNVLDGIPATLTATELGYMDGVTSAVQTQVDGKQFKTFLTVGSADADYITDGTADDVQIQAAIDAANAAGGGTVFIKEGTYAIAATLGVKSNVTIVGEDKNGTVLRVNNAANISVFSTATEGLSHVTIRNLTIDQNGANQSSAGGGFTINKVNDLTIDNCRFKASYNFQVLVGSGTGTALTGTLTFTLGDATVSGSSTAFTTELAEGSIIKTNGGKFARVASIASNTSLELDRQFEYTTETGVAATSYTGNLRVRLINNDFEGSANTDNVGLGLLVGGLIQGNTSFSSGGGYGFGPDHCWYTRFIGNRCYNNDNDGIGMETCSYCIVSNNVCDGSVTGNGIRLLSGSYRNTIIGNICKNNVNGINVTYNSTSFGRPDGNQIIGNTVELNSTHGIRIGGSSRNIIANNKAMNNGSHGISLATDNAVTPDYNAISNNYCHDSQDTKTQTHGISVASGTSNIVVNNHSLTADHVTAGFTDSGTTTQYVESSTWAIKASKLGVGTLAPATMGHFYEDTTGTGTSTGITIEQDGATGDALLQFLLSGVRRWVTGIDNSDSDKYKISPVTDLANAVFAMDTSGNATFSGDVTVPDEAYGVGWNGSLEVPTKNAVYDKIETIAAGSGITRTVTVTSGSYTAGSSSATDYVYLIAGAHTTALPTASGNTNRYTFKNNHSANVTINRDGTDTIEGATSLTLGVGEAIDLVSDGTSNWNVI